MATSGQVLTELALCGVLGIVGQGIRAVIGLKNANTSGSTTPDQQSVFNSAYLLFSFFVGSLAGIAAGFTIGLDKFQDIALPDVRLLLGVVAAGYAGADFIENALSVMIPGQGAPAPVVAPPGGVQAAEVARTPVGNTGPRRDLVAAPSQGGPPADGSQALRAALATVSPRLNAALWAPALVKGFQHYDLDTDRRTAAAIGQFLVEAGAAFQEVRENLNYTHADRIYDVFRSHFSSVEEAQQYVSNPEALANRVYANRLGNGDERSGDGFRFRGRGLIQLTGRDEYERFGATLKMSADQVSAYCETPEGAAMSGCWYLNTNGCLPLADAWSISRITRCVNGEKMLGNAQRIAYAEAVLKALGEPVEALVA